MKKKKVKALWMISTPCEPLNIHFIIITNFIKYASWRGWRSLPHIPQKQHTPQMPFAMGVPCYISDTKKMLLSAFSMLEYTMWHFHESYCKLWIYTKLHPNSNLQFDIILKQPSTFVHFFFKNKKKQVSSFDMYMYLSFNDI